MSRQPEELNRLLNETDSVEVAASRIARRRIYVVGTGTSWHAAEIGAYWLRRAGVDAVALQAADAALYEAPIPSSSALILVSHRGTKLYTSEVWQAAREHGVPSVLISRRGGEGVDLETVDSEISSTHTISFLAALMRLAQLASALGANLGRLSDVPQAVQEVLDGPSPDVGPPARLLQLIGEGPNRWVAAEGALKIREAAYIASASASFEQFLHGLAVGLGPNDAVVSLDGGGAGSARLNAIADMVEANGVDVYRFRESSLGDALSVFPLTVIVHRIALETAFLLGTNPDMFGPAAPDGTSPWESLPL